MSKKEGQEYEVKPLPKSAQIAMREIRKHAEALMQEVLEATIKDLDLKAEEGWEFNTQTNAFVRLTDKVSKKVADGV